jgi:photosystem II stability/assembly factor-like uncharacterized protein
MLPILFRLFFLILLFFAVEGRAQWVKIAPNVLPLIPGNFFSESALDFRSGILWAVSGNMLISSGDSGKSWSFHDLSSFSEIFDVCFFDQNTGLITTGIRGELYITHDGGQTWTFILPHQYGEIGLYKSAFINSPDVIIALFCNPSYCCITTDGGASWTGHSFGGSTFSLGLCFAISSDNRINVFTADEWGGKGIQYLKGSLNISTDFGATWSGNSTLTDGDSYSIAVDSCDPKRFYLANEDYVDPDNDTSEMYLTIDAGSSWKATHSFPIPGNYFSGVLASTRNVIYSGTYAKGIMRSTDKGLSWKEIGGPSVPVDSRSISVADDSTVFVLDAEGSIWRTTNSGGYSLHDYPKVSLATKDVSADTIGTNDLLIPIIVKNLGEQRDIECILHYDPPSHLKYEGSFSKSNVSLDVPNQQWTGRSKLQMPNASSSDSILGYARFTLTADSSIKPKVWFDSLQVFNVIMPCAIYDLFIPSGNTAVSNITMPSGCGTRLLSDFLRTGLILELRVYPNPSEEEITIIANCAITQDARIEISDALGAKVYSENRILPSGQSSIHLPIHDLAQGVYFVRVGDVGKSFVKVK